MIRFKNILYVTESSVDQHSAIARTVTLAENNQAKLSFLHVADSSVPGSLRDRYTSDEIEKRVTARERNNLESLLAAHGPSDRFQVQIGFGIPFIEVIRRVLANDHDLVIKVASIDGGIQNRLFGSNDMHLLRKCPCPIWLMQPEENINYSKIVAAVAFDPWSSEVDDDGLNRKILELACSLALSDFAQLHFVHVWDSMLTAWSDQLSEKTVEQQVEVERERHQAGLHGLARKLRHWVGEDAYDYLSPKFHLVRGDPEEEIPNLANKLGANLVVMGTVARIGIEGLIIGNTAEAILNHIECSVLAVKPDGFVSPVIF